MRWPQPLSPLEAGVALCLNVVREPESTSPQQGALWPVGANPAQRLLMRARVSAGGSRLPPSHTDLVESSFPPPWRRLGLRWLHYARFVCTLDDESFWQAACVLGLGGADTSHVTPIVARTSAWTEALADHLLRRFGLMFYAASDEGQENGVGGELAAGHRFHFGAQFGEQIFLFGAYGPNARDLFCDPAPDGEQATTFLPRCAPLKDAA